MIKLETVGAMKHLKNDPTVIADGEIVNGYVFTIGSDKKTDAPTSTTAKGLNLYVAMNEFSGDDKYQNKKIANGAKVNAFLMSEFDHENLIITDDNLTTAYASINANDNMVVDTNGKFAVETTLTGYKLYLTVLEKIKYAGRDAVRAAVVLA